MSELATMDASIKQTFIRQYGMTEEECERLWDACLRGDWNTGQDICDSLVAKWKPSVRRRGRPRIYPPAHYRAVAEIYNRAGRENCPPTMTVATYFTVPKSTASKWVAKARERGFLPPTSPGVPTLAKHRPVWADVGRGTERFRRWQVCDECLVPWPCAGPDG